MFAGAADVFVDETADDHRRDENNNFAAARYAMADGTLDGTTGSAERPRPTCRIRCRAARPPRGGVAARRQGVVVGPTNVDAITQVGGDEQVGCPVPPRRDPDAGFGAGGVDGNGRVSTNFGLESNGAGTADSPAAVALQPDGKIVVVGRTDPSAPTSATSPSLATRPTATSTPPSTRSRMMAATRPTSGGPRGRLRDAVAIEGTPGDPSFRIVVAGAKSGATQSSDDFAVAVYEEDGPRTTPSTSTAADHGVRPRRRRPRGGRPAGRPDRGRWIQHLLLARRGNALPAMRPTEPRPGVRLQRRGRHEHRSRFGDNDGTRWRSRTWAAVT